MDVRKGQGPEKLAREEFSRRFRQQFYDPSFAAAEDAVAALEEIAWKNYQASRKSPRTRKAGPGFADPDYDLSLEWIEARDRIQAAAALQKNPQAKRRVLLICGSSRNDKTCPGEISKSFRLTQLARETLEQEGLETDVLDLSLLTSEYGRTIHPCKGCVSTAMPLCHFPCSCYPNHSLNQTNDWMNEIYERWTRAHGVIILTPVYWYQAASPLKLMIDRLVCADGGNPDPTSTSGKDPAKAKAIELKGWSYPKHLEGRAYGLVVHGDVAGIEAVRRALSDWLDWMGMIACGFHSRLDRYIGYYEPYATSHATLDKDTAVQEEVRNVARAVAKTIFSNASRIDAGLTDPRPK
jgi:multimeric flavodoxin WrbA